MLRDDMYDAFAIQPIIQSGRAPRAGQRGEPAAQHGRRLAGRDLSDQHVGPLRAAPEAALPRQLSVLLRTLLGQRGPKHLVERR